jgi:hypothetical protein
MSTKIAPGILLVFIAVVTAHADAPQGVIIQTQVIFGPEGDEGTFTVTPQDSPLCASGTLRSTGFAGVANRPIRVLTHWEFVCDDNSGTFSLQFHPHFGRDPTFTLSGPWSVRGDGNTGDYVGLSGHGDFGVVVVFDENGVPLRGEETFVGFVQLN